jgi:hydrogenase maturation protein HypF
MVADVATPNRGLPARQDPATVPAGGERADVVLRVRGTVQGVGFRPFVLRAATRLHLAGWVRNDPQGVLIRAAGARPAVDSLVRALKAEAPPAARVVSVEEQSGPSQAAIGASDFVILPSEMDCAEIATAAPPDLALCQDCRGELATAADRRFAYPFINCTQCGPRYSILERLPYDRARTTMRAFRMCPQCQAEYDDPADRRFHAQPDACPKCGPRAVLMESTGAEVAWPQALNRAAAIIKSGGILAVKGVGGYHLMVDATNGAAVSELRRRKEREEKPFAVMFPDLTSARDFAEVSDEAAALLTSAAAPIVLLPRLAAARQSESERPRAELAAEIAPGNPWIGAVLPYAPLHLLLLQALGRPVVATSGNLSEEPLCTGENDAHRRLAAIADAFLDHNRRIAHPVDDSVVRIGSAGPLLLRRARGYAPTPLQLPGRVNGSWLCVGAQMKNTLAVATGDRVVLSPHIGDLDGAATREAFRRTVQTLGTLHGGDFSAVVCDKHPDYASTRYAEETRLPLVAVQHHLAHVLACLLEHGRTADNVLGVAWDGTGYGEDGTIWGGEFLLLQNQEACRFARIRQFRLPGGEAAIRDGRRTALGLAHAENAGHFEDFASAVGFPAGDAATLRVMLDRGINSPFTSSAGRLFDAAGALLGLGGRNRFEGQIPLAVEAAASSVRSAPRTLSFPVRSAPQGSGALLELDWEPLIGELRAARGRGDDSRELALAFHRALAAGMVAVARAAGVGTVALSGGCFQNILLLDLASSALRDAGFEVLVPRELPPNDGAIAAGQALGALWNLSSVRLP